MSDKLAIAFLIVTASVLATAAVGTFCWFLYRMYQTDPLQAVLMAVGVTWLSLVMVAATWIGRHDRGKP